MIQVLAQVAPPPTTWPPLLLPAIIFVCSMAAFVAWIVYALRKRSELAQMPHYLGLDPRDLSDPDRIHEELDALLGGSYLYRSGYVTVVDSWLQGRRAGTTVHVIMLREYPVPGSFRGDDATAFYRRAEFSDNYETFVVLQTPLGTGGTGGTAGTVALDLPRFLLVPNNMFLNMTDSSRQVVSFANARFIKRNRITSPDQAATYFAFTPPVQRMFLDNRDLSVESLDNTLVLCRYGCRLSPRDVAQLIELGQQLGAGLAAGLLERRRLLANAADAAAAQATGA
ncbi:MAG: hypothetical protein WD042_18265 [Phycisphaeraceae bacterium]